MRFARAVTTRRTRIPSLSSILNQASVIPVGVSQAVALSYDKSFPDCGVVAHSRLAAAVVPL